MASSFLLSIFHDFAVFLWCFDCQSLFCRVKLPIYIHKSTIDMTFLY